MTWKISQRRKLGLRNRALSTERSYNPGLALLKLIAAFGIVGCHLNMRPTTPMGEALLHFTDTNVALFGILSGYFLASSLERAEGVWPFICKKAKRLLPVYAVWSLFYLLIKFGLDFATTGHLTESFKSPMRWFYVIFWGDAAAHLWYVISLFYVSVVLCLLRRWLRWLWLVLAVGAFIWVMKGWGGFYSWYPGRLLAFVAVGIGVGSYRAVINTVSIFAVVGCGILALGVHLFSPVRGLISVYDAWLCAPLILLFVRLKIQFSDQMFSVVNCSFGVYLVHVAIAFVLGRVARSVLHEPYSALVILLVWSMVFVVALGVSWLMSRVLFLKRLVV